MPRERTYRGTFATVNRTMVGLDFYAENIHFARDHARQVAGHDAMHKELGPLTLVTVIAIPRDQFKAGDAGSWYRV